MSSVETNFDELISYAAAVRKAVVLDASVYTSKVVPIIKEDFLELFKNEGQSIGKPFPKEKQSGKPFEKYRKYTLPSELQRWQKGIWSGGTAFSMLNFTKTDHANTTISIQPDKLIVDVEVPGEEGKVFANVTIGVSALCLEKIKNEMFSIISQRVSRQYIPKVIHKKKEQK